MAGRNESICIWISQKAGKLIDKHYSNQPPASYAFRYPPHTDGGLAQALAVLKSIYRVP